MRILRLSFFAPVRMLGPAVFFVVATTLGPAITHAAGGDGDGDGHQQALAALSDVKAAVAELMQADASYATDREVYRRASQRAINALVGTGSGNYVAGAGTPADTLGAIGHVDALLDRRGTPVWVAPLHGAEANMRAAVAHLRDSLKARELMDYEIVVSRALTYLEVARGRPTEIGVLGGLEGALANTVLGVPEGAQQSDACAVPAAAPTYGTHGGYIAWVTLPANNGVHTLAEDPGGSDVTVQHGTLVLHTAAAALVATECARHAAEVPVAMPLAPTPVAARAMPVVSYTKAQAAAGAEIFAARCVSCHGVNLQGTAAPSVAGTDFLTTAEHNGWTLEVVRYIVFKLMPKTAPGSLSPQEGASIMAFLLASNCYPAGNTPFPTSDDAKFGSFKLGPVPGAHPDRNDLGVCTGG